jgi:hypothetical protein
LVSVPQPPAKVYAPDIERDNHAASDLAGLKHIIAAFGLAPGAVLGVTGTFVAQSNLQAWLWAFGRAGLVMAAARPTLKYIGGS